MQTWRLTKLGEKRFRTGHPWVFSNELINSPKSVLPGELVKLADQENKFLALGYAHPNSLICFRVLSYRDEPQIDGEWFFRRFLQAAKLRKLSEVDRQGDGLQRRVELRPGSRPGRRRRLHGLRTCGCVARSPEAS